MTTSTPRRPRGAGAGAGGGPAAKAFAATRHFRPVLALVIVLFAYFAVTQGESS